MATENWLVGQVLTFGGDLRERVAMTGLSTGRGLRLHGFGVVIPLSNERPHCGVGVPTILRSVPSMTPLLGERRHGGCGPPGLSTDQDVKTVATTLCTCGTWNPCGPQ